MKTKFKRLKIEGLIECWKAFCDYMVNEKGWVLQDRFKYYERELRLYNDKEELIDIIGYYDFTQITKSIYYRVTQYLILGEPYSLENGNGYLKARRIEEQYRDKIYVAPGTTGTSWGGKDYCIIKWCRPSIKLNSDKAYILKCKFSIARDNNGTGLHQRFKMARERNPSLQFAYDYHPSNSMF